MNPSSRDGPWPQGASGVGPQPGAGQSIRQSTPGSGNVLPPPQGTSFSAMLSTFPPLSELELTDSDNTGNFYPSQAGHTLPGLAGITQGPPPAQEHSQRPLPPPEQSSG